MSRIFSAIAWPSRPFLPWLIFLAALVPRLAAVGRYVTPDELNWVLRSLRMRQALLAHDWANTIQTGHPGVTTTWIGAVAIQVQLWLQPAKAGHVEWLNRLHWLSTENVEAYRLLYAFLNGNRLAVALVTCLVVVLVYYLVRDLLGDGAGLVAAALLALDPFYGGLSGLLHVDGLLATFTLLALLLSLRSVMYRRRRDAVLAGVATAAAILSKTPGLLLLAFMPAIFGVGSFLALRRAGPERTRMATARATFGDDLARSFLWLAAFLLTALIILPALLVAPLDTLQTLTGLSGQFAEAAVRPGFFLGKMVLDPGPAFYPLVVLFRLSPVTTIGLGLALLTFYGQQRLPHVKGASPNLFWLLLFSLTFLVAVTLVAQKYDRYSLPSLVMLTVVAAWGVACFARRVQRFTPYIIALAVFGQLVYLLFHMPYPLTAHNWFAGGGSVASRVLPAGWGESAGLAARWLAGTLAEPEQVQLFTTNLTGTAPFFPGQVIRLKQAQLSRLRPDDYLLLFEQGQGMAELDLGNRQPVQQFRLNQGERALLYTGFQPQDFGLAAMQLQPHQQQFGHSIQLVAAAATFLPWPEEMALLLGWQLQPSSQPSASYQLQLELLDVDGETRVHHEVPFLNQSDQPPVYWQPGETQYVSYTIVAPPDLPPGAYQLIARLFNAEGQQLGVFDGAGRFAGTQAALETVQVTAPVRQPTLEIPQRLSNATELIGYGPLPERVSTGEPLRLDLWWQSANAAPGELVLEIGGVEASTVLATNGWKEDQTYHIRPKWRVPLDIPPGRQPVTIQWWSQDGTPRWPEALPLGETEIVARERHFQLPWNLDPLHMRFGKLAQLEGVSTTADDSLTVELVWQADSPTDVPYTVFVHLRDASGAVIEQLDRPPALPTTSWARDEVIVETYELARPPAGTYTLAVGLYDARNGQRLAVYNASGEPLPNDEYLLPVEVP